MIIGYEKIAVIFILHLYIVAHCTKIIAQVQVSGGAYAAHYNLFAHNGSKIQNGVEGIKKAPEWELE
jgi:hypothetical protein